MDSDDLVVVYTANHPAEAQLVRNILEDEGIASQSQGEHQGALPGVFNVDVVVRANDADLARSIIDRHQAG
jgi:hypothetical protein